MANDDKDFEGRFSRVVVEHYRGELDSLPADKRADVIDRLRERFREYEQDPDVNNERQAPAFLEKWGTSIKAARQDTDRIVDDAVKRDKAERKPEPGKDDERREAARQRAQELRDRTPTHSPDRDRER